MSTTRRLMLNENDDMKKEIIIEIAQGKSGNTTVRSFTTTINDICNQMGLSYSELKDIISEYKTPINNIEPSRSDLDVKKPYLDIMNNYTFTVYVYGIYGTKTMSDGSRLTINGACSVYQNAHFDFIVNSNNNIELNIITLENFNGDNVKLTIK